MTTIINNSNRRQRRIPPRRTLVIQNRTTPTRNTRPRRQRKSLAPPSAPRGRAPRKRNPIGRFTLAPRPRGPDPRSMLSIVQSTPGARDFLNCRVAPFSANGPMSSIPDGSMTRKIMVDHRLQIPFTLGTTGSMNIAVTPCIPNPVWFQSPVSDTYTAAGHTYGSWTSASYNTVCIPGWDQGSVSLHNTAGSYDDCEIIYNASKSRIVTAAWSITYTGATINNSGVMRVNVFQTGALPPVPNTASFTVIDGTAGNTEVWSADQVLVRSFAQNLNFGAGSSQDTRTIPLRSGAHGLLRHNGSDYQWQDLSSNLTFLTTPADERYSLLNSTGAISASSKLGHIPDVSSFDSDWASTLISITGAAASSSFLLDVIYCIEYTPNPADSTYALAKPAPPRNDMVIQAVDRVANAQPVAETGNSTTATLQSAIKNAASVISTGAAIASVFV